MTIAFGAGGERVVYVYVTQRQWLVWHTVGWGCHPQSVSPLVVVRGVQVASVVQKRWVVAG